MLTYKNIQLQIRSDQQPIIIKVGGFGGKGVKQKKKKKLK